MAKEKRILTGHRPTGPRHIGHLVGTLETWSKLQETYDCFFLVADLHVLTTDFEHPAQIQSNILEMVIDWLAAGIDVSQATLVLQSALPQHAQLSALLGMLVTTARLERVPTYKEQVNQLNLNPSLGLLSYPVLQAADILLYRADTVPVGEDQLPHIELARELARRFNQLYGPLFPEPEALLSPAPRLPGIDNRTMHTSYGNAIFLKDTPEETAQKVMSMYTDPTRIHTSDPGHIVGNPVFTYLDLFDPNPGELSQIKQAYEQGKIGDVEVKRRLVQVLNDALAPIRQRRSQLAAHPQDVREYLQMGTARARYVAEETLQNAMDKMGLGFGASLSNPVELSRSGGAFC